MRIFLLCCCFCWTLQAAEGIGDLCDLHRVDFVGGEPYAAEDLRTALLGHRESFLLLHPQSTPAQFREAVVAGLRRGFQGLGHPEVRITMPADLAGGQVTVRIDQGPRFACGELRIEGSEEAELRQWLRDSLLLPYDEEDALPLREDREGKEPYWPREDGPPFHDGGLMGMQQRVAWALRMRGLLAADFSLRLQRDDAAQAAHLVVTVRDPGPVVRCRAIRLSGLKHHQEEEILPALPLQVGEPLSLSRLEQTRSLLHDSGCFLESTVEFDETDPGLVRIELIDDERLPHFGQPLSEVAAAMRSAVLAAREALARRRCELDLRFNAEPFGRGQVVIAPGRGFWITWRKSSTGLTLLIDGRSAFLRCGDGPWLGVANELTGSLELDLRAFRPDEEGNTSGLNFSAGVVTGADEAFRFDLGCDPAAALRADWLEGYQLTVVEGRSLLVRDDGNGSHFAWHLAADGRPERIELNRPGEAELQVELTSGRFDALSLAVDGQGERSIPAPQFAGLFTLAFARELLALSDQPEIERGMSALVRMFDELPLFPAEDPLTDGEAAPDFSIPIDGLPFDPSTGLAGMLMPLAYRLSLDLAPYDHWLPAVLREANRGLLGDWRTVQPELRRLYNHPDLGPVGCLLIARLSAFVDGDLAEVFRARGRERCDGEHLRRELLPLLTGHLDGLNRALPLIAAHPALDELALLVPAEQREIARQALTRFTTLAAAGAADPDLLIVVPILWDCGIGGLLREALAPSAP
jgi:hypothetical protein